MRHRTHELLVAPRRNPAQRKTAGSSAPDPHPTRRLREPCTSCTPRCVVADPTLIWDHATNCSGAHTVQNDARDAVTVEGVAMRVPFCTAGMHTNMAVKSTNPLILEGEYRPYACPALGRSLIALLDRVPIRRRPRADRLMRRIPASRLSTVGVSLGILLDRGHGADILPVEAADYQSPERPKDDRQGDVQDEPASDLCAAVQWFE
jgi:hypothetical protein